MKRKLGKRLRSVIGIVLTLGVFMFILLVLNSWLGEKDVRFDYRAMFTYLGSKDNEPLDNIWLIFPAPQIENRFAGNIFSSWELYYVEDNTSLTLQSTPTGIVNLRGVRGSQLEIYTSIAENSPYGPSLTWEIDRLYPREVFMDYGWTWAPKEKADSVTLRSYGIEEDWSHGYWYTSEAEQENKRIDFSFTVELYRENVLNERYGVIWENQVWGSYALVKIV